MKTPGWALVLLLVTGDASAKKKPRPDYDQPDDRPPDPALIAEKQRTRIRTLEPWIGTWTGKLKWSGCAIDGAAKLKMDLGVALTVDGAKILDGIGPFTWGVAGNQLAMIGEGFEASVIPSKKKGASFRLQTSGGCVGKATITRPSSKLPSCDTLRALATIEASCPSLDATTRDDDLARVTKSWKAWTKLKGKKKKARAAACLQEADALRERILVCGGG